MKFLLITILIPLFCFAQEVDVTSKVIKIDSIANSNGAFTQSSGLIHKKRFLFGRKTIGGFSEDIYLDSIYTSTNLKQRHMIKGSYQHTISINRKKIEYIHTDFYYHDGILILARVNKTLKQNNSEPISLNYKIDMTKCINPHISEEIGFDIRKWISIRDANFTQAASLVHKLSICDY